MSDIFLSYSSKDREWARSLANSLESRGWSVWWDRTIPAGKTFTQVITQALADARCVVVAWSDDSIKSNWVLEEAEEGRSRGILVPVLMENVMPPLGFRSIQAADLSHWDGEEESREFQKLVEDIVLVIGSPKKPDEEQVHVSVEPKIQRPTPAETMIGPREQVEDVAAKQAKAPSLEVPQAHLKPIFTPYLILQAAGALVAGLLIGTNHGFYWRQFDAFSFHIFLTPSIYALGLSAGLILANRLTYVSLGAKLMTTAGAIFTTAVIVMLYPLSRAFPNPLVNLLIWAGISLFVLFATTVLSRHWTLLALNRFLLGGVSGLIAGAFLATAVAAFSGDFRVFVSHGWLMLFADGIVLGTLGGFIDSVEHLTRRSGLPMDQLSRP